MNATRSFLSRIWSGIRRVRDLIEGDDLYDAQHHRSDDHEQRPNLGFGFPGPTAGG